MSWLKTSVAAAAMLAGAAASAQTSSPSGQVLTGRAAFGSWHEDAPGVRRRIEVGDLPVPYATKSASNGPGVVDRPPGAALKVPPGFKVDLYAAGLDGPRLLRTAPNGDLFVAETRAGRIRVFAADAKEPRKGEIFASGLDEPFGIAFYPSGPDPRWVYVANVNSVVRFPYRSGDRKARLKPETVVPRLTRETGGHSTRDVAFNREGSRMLVSVGSASNVAQGSPAGEGKAGGALGAAGGDEEGRADVLSFTPEGRDRTVFATGIRNCVGLAVNPNTGDPWCSTNERDGLGDDLVPDYVTRVREGAFYGWPWYYLGDHQDPRHKGERPDLKSKVTVPDILLQAHSATLQMTFYTGDAFPAEYRGDAFSALHGSWNRSGRTGYKIIRMKLRDGVPTGDYEDFVTGFVASDRGVWGRPVGIATGADGSLFFSEDGNGTIWRVSYVGSRAAK